MLIFPFFQWRKTLILPFPEHGTGGRVRILDLVLVVSAATRTRLLSRFPEVTVQFFLIVARMETQSFQNPASDTTSDMEARYRCFSPLGVQNTVYSEKPSLRPLGQCQGILYSLTAFGKIPVCFQRTSELSSSQLFAETGILPAALR